MMGVFLDIRVWLAVLAISALGTVTTLAYYYLGKQGAKAVLERVPQITEERWDRAQHLYQEYGTKLLFMSGLPVVGVLLQSAAGALGVGLAAYVVWVLFGRLVRNWVLLLLFDQALGLFVGG
jgi:membrane protein YqaA with SNARE-associated domain